MPAPGALAVVGAEPVPGKAGAEGVQHLRIDGAFVYYGVGRFEDDRGLFEEIEVQASEPPTILQSAFASSQKNVLRGMHCSPYGKIVVCLSGEMFDALVDLRPDSKTYLQWDAALLSPERRTRIYVPPGVGHGYLAMQDNTSNVYLKLGLYEKSKELEVNALDPALGIQWPKPLVGTSYIISPKDSGLPSLEKAKELPTWGQTRSKL